MQKTKRLLLICLCVFFVLVVCVTVYVTAFASKTLVTTNVQSSDEILQNCGESVQSLEELVALGRKGDILISATNESGFEVYDLSFAFRHGHAAIIYSEDEVMHCRGVGNVSELVSLPEFFEAEQVRLYTISGVSDEQAASVANYAKENLLDIPYMFLASFFSKSTLNCTTIVYHAYKDELNITFNTIANTVSPASFVSDDKTICIGNINWQGDANSFEN